MNFEIELIKLETNSLNLSYFLVPRDSEIMSMAVAQIANIDVTNFDMACKEFQQIMHWKKDHCIQLSSCRLSENKTLECLLLQQFGYRYVELNYRPELDLVRYLFESDDEFQFMPALDSDEEVLINMAASVFHSGRFHDDLNLGAALGNVRYGQWMRNAFLNPEQEVIKVVRQQEIVAFFVQEYPNKNEVFWSLVGLAPGSEGKGIGGRVWRSYLAQLRETGVTRVSTSISSRNVPVFNLYISLGFRFPQPSITFHWHANYSYS